MKNNRILFVTDIFPFPPTTGGMLRIANIIKQLSKSYSVDLVSFNDFSIKSAQKNEAFIYCKNVFYFYPKGKKIIGRIINLFRGKCDNEYRIFSEAMQLTIDGLVKKNHYSYIFAERIYTYQFLRKFNEKIILDMHDVEREAIYNMLIIEPNILKKVRYLFELKKIKKLENEVFNKVYAVSFVSEFDKNKYLKYIPNYSCKYIVIDNGVEIFDSTTCLFSKRDKNQVLFVGSLKHPPNIHGLKWFLRDVWPFIVKKQSSLQFTIIGGGNLDHELKSLVSNSKNVQCKGFVSDISEYLENSAVLVVPLLSGSGTRLKILEAFSSRLPVVSTTKGAEGISCLSGKHLIISDTKEQFQEAIQHIVNDEIFSENMVNAAYELVLDKYDWNVIGNKIVKELN